MDEKQNSGGNGLRHSLWDCPDMPIQGETAPTLSGPSKESEVESYSHTVSLSLIFDCTRVLGIKSIAGEESLKARRLSDVLHD